MDNKFADRGCPAVMDYSAHFTNYSTNVFFDQAVRKVNKIENGNDYRKFLQDKATGIMQKERDHFLNNYTCSKR